MVISATTRVALRPLFASRTVRRAFSVKAIYSSFPATLLHYSPRNKVDLYDEQEASNRPDDHFDNRVSLNNGLVYPSASSDSRELMTVIFGSYLVTRADTNQSVAISNGALLCPNTFMMQEFLRLDYDEFLNREAGGQEVETPYIYSVPKGKSVAQLATLLNSMYSCFIFRNTALNIALNEFFRKHAQIEKADTWLKKHPYHLANDDTEDTKWMAE
ncbi:hypothetical protein RRF57_011434 [Xylaria bambusicola]|uniref:Tse2 ADP-ribosyltransferase toxin domain-containing protein n=1 Tax=Xylaria bambusicola TaxID=326684 RepID=A0AAN7ZA29_9PEZI